MTYAPGSFTKDPSWDSVAGLGLLHRAIRRGFSSALRPVATTDWRRSSGFGTVGVTLIPPRFFLLNSGRNLVVDELVYRAVALPHDSVFDRLALFSLNLSHIGNPPGSLPRRPALWANEFVRGTLWQHGGWQREALSRDTLPRELGALLNVEPSTLTKVVTNYRHLFARLGYADPPSGTVDTRASEWAANALFLAWDRLFFGRQASKIAELTKTSREEELHKFIGVPERWLATRQRSIAEEYLAAGGINRFSNRNYAPEIRGAASPKAAPVLDQVETDAEIERREITHLRQQRDRRKAAALKALYENECSFCGTRLNVGPGRYYSEAAHIRPLGKPGNGPDTTLNMLVLCPNHHLQFDAGVFRLRKRGSDWEIICKDTANTLHRKAVTFRHEIADRHINWHHEHFK
jgi:hypothetical protein